MSEQSYFKLNGRIWIEDPHEKILGHGRVELLERIHACASIRQAALQMKMSYKRAWDLIKHINEKFGVPIVISSRGGKGGGKAVVTEKGLDIIRQYHELQHSFQEFLKYQAEVLKIR